MSRAKLLLFLVGLSLLLGSCSSSSGVELSGDGDAVFGEQIVQDVESLTASNSELFLSMADDIHATVDDNTDCWVAYQATEKDSSRPLKRPSLACGPIAVHGQDKQWFVSELQLVGLGEGVFALERAGNWELKKNPNYPGSTATLFMGGTSDIYSVKELEVPEIHETQIVGLDGAVITNPKELLAQANKEFRSARNLPVPVAVQSDSACAIYEESVYCGPFLAVGGNVDRPYILMETSTIEGVAGVARSFDVSRLSADGLIATALPTGSSTWWPEPLPESTLEVPLPAPQKPGLIQPFQGTATWTSVQGDNQVYLGRVGYEGDWETEHTGEILRVSQAESVESGGETLRAAEGEEFYLIEISEGLSSAKFVVDVDGRRTNVEFRGTQLLVSAPKSSSNVVLNIVSRSGETEVDIDMRTGERVDSTHPLIYDLPDAFAISEIYRYAYSFNVFDWNRVKVAEYTHTIKLNNAWLSPIDTGSKVFVDKDTALLYVSYELVRTGIANSFQADPNLDLKERLSLELEDGTTLNPTRISQRWENGVAVFEVPWLTRSATLTLDPTLEKDFDDDGYVDGELLEIKIGEQETVELLFD